MGSMGISSDPQLEREVTPLEEGSGEEDIGEGEEEGEDIGEVEGDGEEQEDEGQENTDMNSSSINLFSSPRQPSSLTKTNPFKVRSGTTSTCICIQWVPLYKGLHGNLRVFLIRMFLLLLNSTVNAVQGLCP